MRNESKSFSQETMQEKDCEGKILEKDCVGRVSR